MKIHFYKYQGTGNDFVILDNRDDAYSSLTEEQVHLLCDRRFGIGSDGLMMLGNAEGYDFSMKYYNADGKEGSMCGNGGRCLVQFAHDQAILRDHYSFIAVDGPHEAVLNENRTISLKMSDVHEISWNEGNAMLNTGSPHFIQFKEELEQLDVFNEGRKIRYKDTFRQEGINVNFVQKDPDGIRIRTYERGVEDETLSCGTGATASAIASTNALGQHTIPVQVQGGQLSITFTRINENQCENIWLTGPATFVFKGEITL